MRISLTFLLLWFSTAVSFSQTVGIREWNSMPLNSILGYWGTAVDDAYCRVLKIETYGDGYRCGIYLSNWDFKWVNKLTLVNNQLTTRYGTFKFEPESNSLIGIFSGRTVEFRRISTEAWQAIGHGQHYVTFPSVPISKTSTLFSITIEEKEAVEKARQLEITRAAIKDSMAKAMAAQRISEEQNRKAAIVNDWGSIISNNKPPKGNSMEGFWASIKPTFARAFKVTKDGGLYAVDMVISDWAQKHYENLTVDENRLNTEYGAFIYIPENDVMLDKSLTTPVRFIRITEENWFIFIH